MPRKKKDRNRTRQRPPEKVEPTPTAQSRRLAELLRAGALFVCSLALLLGPLAPSLSFNFGLRIVISMLFFLGGAMWAAQMAVTGKVSFLKTGMAWPAAIFFGAVVCSAAAAWSLREALIHSLSWASYAVGFLVLLNLSGRPRNRHVLAVLLVAVAVVVSAHGVHQVFVSLPETRAEFYRDPEAALQAVGVPLDAKHDFVGRLGVNRVMSTFLLPTSLSGFLVLAIPVALGISLDQWRDRRLVLPSAHFTLQTFFILLMLLCLFLTKSKGGWLAFAVALAVFGIGSADWFKRRFGRPILALLACGMVVAVVAQYAGMLPPLRDYRSSLLARTAYWRAAAASIASQPALGAGPGGFADAYSIHKRPQDEETRYAHNDYLQLGAEIGLVGLFGYLALWWRFWRKAGLKAKETEIEVPASDPECLWAVWPVAAGAAAFALALAFDLLPGSAQGHWRWVWPLSLGLLWMGAALVNSRPSAIVNVDGGMASVGLRAGIAGFLAHGLLDFDLYVQGIAQTVAIMAALAVAGRASRHVFEKAVGPTGRFALAVVPAGLALAVWVGLAAPVMRATALFEDATSQAIELPVEQRIALLERSVELDPWNGPAHARLARKYYQYEGNLAKAVRQARRAVELNSARAGHRDLLANLYLETYRATRNPASLQRAYEEMREAARLFPSYPKLHARLGSIAGTMGRHGEELNRLSHALALDRRQAIPRRRLDPVERDALEARVAELEEQMRGAGDDDGP